MTRVGWAAVLAPVFVPPLALAACPTAADLPHGIYVTYEDGSLSRFRSGPEGTVLEDVFYDESFVEGYRYVTRAGVFPLESLDIVAGQLDRASATETLYPEGTAFPAVSPGLAWRAEVRVRSERDGEHLQAISLNVGSAREEVYGECTFAVLPLELRFQDEISDTVESLDFVTDLGIAIFRGGAGFGEETSLQVPIGISRVAPAELPAL